MMRELIVGNLKSARPGTAESGPVNGDHALNGKPRAGGALKPAAVLVPIVERDAGLTVLLTQRTDHLNAHAGQVSFPGGRTEPEDRTPVHTALREAREEVGLEPGFVEVAGLLDTYQTGTGFLVTPVVGFVRPGFSLAPDSFEVADVFEVPLEFVMDPANHRIEKRAWNGAERRYYVLRYEGRFIWGATAGMLVNLYRRTYRLTHG